MVTNNISLEGKTVLVTGAAGFIGSNLVKRLFNDVKNIKVIGIDSITDYYDVNIKYERLKEIDALVSAIVSTNVATVPGVSPSATATVPDVSPSVSATVPGVSPSVSATVPGVSPSVSTTVPDVSLSASATVPDVSPSVSTTVPDVSLSASATVPDASPSGSSWLFIHGDIADRATVEKIFAENKISVVVNLAAQAGVRYSITNPDSYIHSNLIGFYNLLEACRHSYDHVSCPQSQGPSSVSCDMSQDSYRGVEHLVYASSSSVYGSNKKVPYSTDDKVDNPVSLYAATKKSNELMAHAYSKLYNIPSTGLRFFTVYGPAGRPDMAYFGFTNKLREGKTIQIFNYGHCKRDFTYVDDIVEGVVRIMQHAPEKANGEDGLPIPPYKVYNIGNNSPENLLDFVTILQEELIRANVLPQDYDFESHKELVPMQPGDVPVTYADTTPLETDFGFKPTTSLRTGLRAFAEWYANYYGTSK